MSTGLGSSQVNTDWRSWSGLLITSWTQTQRQSSGGLGGRGVVGAERGYGEGTEGSGRAVPTQAGPSCDHGQSSALVFPRELLP